MQPHLTRLSDYALMHAAETPGSEACVFGHERVTYKQLASATDLVARALLRIGTHRGDRVMLVAFPGPEYLVMLLACARIGAIFVGADPRQNIDDIEQIIHDAKPQVLIGIGVVDSHDLAEDLGTIMFSCPETQEFVLIGGTTHRFATPFDDFLEDGAKLPLERVDQAAAHVRPDDVLSLVYIRGATNAMKGVMLSHRNFIEVYSRTAQIYLADPMRVINNYPICHLECQGGITAHAIIAGGCQVFLERFKPEETLLTVPRERITVWGQEVSMFQRIVSEPSFPATDLSSLQQIWWSGGIAPPSLINKLAQTGAICSTRWGTPETSGPAVLSDPEAESQRFDKVIGKTTRGFDMRIVDTRERRSNENEPGHIQIRGDCLMTGYYHRLEETSDVVDGHNWLRTGYVGAIDENGDLKLIGRLDDIYISGGYAVHPGEIERVFERHPAVMRACVIGIPDDQNRQIGVAYVQPLPGQKLPDKEIEAYISERLAPHARLQHIWIREQLPEDLIGNIDRRTLRAEARRTTVQSRRISTKRFRALDSI